MHQIKLFYKGINHLIKEFIMADIVTGTVTGQVDTTTIQEAFSDVRRENAKEASDSRTASARQAFDVNDRVGSEADRVVAQDTAYFIAGQSQNFSNATALAALKAGTDMQFANTLAAINQAATSGQAATALEGAKTAAASALGQALIGSTIVADGNATRALINTLKMEELNRVLAERNAEIIEHRGDSRHYRDNYANSQTNALSSQINALHSQFQAATQGTVNFGTMSGSAGTQASTNNTVR
jgi:hypothetical protein